GLKGVQVGQAAVSSVHANFIVNEGKANAQDVITLMRQVRQTVKEKKGIILQPEIIALGREWKDWL
ncbi:MAG: hypothetical protein EBS00_07945, partial [Verrucomicrobia bacterium]|nr:hypothetical protein [Verrucomicrobiota bacterium]